MSVDGRRWMVEAVHADLPISAQCRLPSIILANKKGRRIAPPALWYCSVRNAYS